MTTDKLYVIAIRDTNNNGTDNKLFNNKVYTEKPKNVGSDCIVLTLDEWVEENFDAGYVDAYG